ncbi:DUF935 family protein, partial [Escherichia coli]|nr:DUF935 family protein [Escherichia coli]
WPVAFKKGGMKFWLRFAEKFGSPWVIGKHPRGANDAEIEKLLDSMEQMVEDAVAAIPDDSSIELKAADGKALAGLRLSKELGYLGSLAI